MSARRVVLVAVLIAGWMATWPTAASARTSMPRVTCSSATWTSFVTGPNFPLPPDFPGPATLTGCNQGPQTGGGGTLSNLLNPVTNVGSESGSAIATWANGATTTFHFTEKTILPSVTQGLSPLPKGYVPCELGYPYIFAVIRVTGRVIGNTPVGTGDTGVRGPIHAVICDVRGPGMYSGETFLLANRGTFKI